MKAMVLGETTSLGANTSPLVFSDMPVPVPGNRELLLKVLACGVCHTDLDIIEGRTPPSHLPVIPGHQVVGRVVEAGPGAETFSAGERVGVAWIYSSCRRCRYCREGNENLCEDFRATGRDADGGYAEYMVVPEDYSYGIPELFSDIEAAPLLCAGAIGYRSLRLAGMVDGDRIGLVGFGSSAHLVLKMIRHLYPRSKVSVFSRTEGERRFAMDLGAAWTGDFTDEAPERLRCAIDTTPAWGPVVSGLRNLDKGGRLIINAIRKEDYDKQDLLGLDYSADLWMEKEVKSVANITRRDVSDFLRMASEIPVRPEVQEYALEEANTALAELKNRMIHGAKVLRIGR